MGLCCCVRAVCEMLLVSAGDAFFDYRLQGPPVSGKQGEVMPSAFLRGQTETWPMKPLALTKNHPATL
jgi:hypothetical protein